MMQLNGHIPGMIHYGVGHVRELYWLPGEVASADAEEHLGVNKYLSGEKYKEQSGYYFKPS